MKAGTIISCPDCGLPQIQSTKDILPGKKMQNGAWISVGWDMDGMRMGCYACGALWSRKHPRTGKTQLYINGEWVPLDKYFQNGEKRKPLVIL